MSFLAKLMIDDIEYNVIELDYTIGQQDDGSGLPNERATGGKLLVTIASTRDTDLISWAMSDRALKDGELILYNRDSISTFRKIAFTGAYCLKFREKFNGNNDLPLFSEILISARELTIKDAKHTNPWPSLT